MTTLSALSKATSLVLALALTGCGADDPPATATDAGGETGADTAGADAATDATPDAAPTDAGAESSADTGVDAGPSCTSARDTALGPIASVSAGLVSVVKEEGGVRTLYVDASAGGSAAAKTNPWVYLDLTSGKRVDVDDKAALTSKSWDLAIKRPLLRNDSGDSGAGDGGAVFLKGKDFATVTKADASAATVSRERWFDDTCTLQTDATGAIKTTFDGWYEYDSATSKLTPAAGTWIVQGADGKRRFKVAIQTYYGNPDGTVGATSGRYVLRVGGLE